jgi:hypothetical protein
MRGISRQDIEKHREDIKAITRGSVRCPPRLWMTRTWERIGIPSPDGLRPQTWIRKQSLTTERSYCHGTRASCDFALNSRH